MSEGGYDGESDLTYELSEVVVYANSTRSSSSTFTGGITIGGSSTIPNNEPPSSPPTTTPSNPSTERKVYKPLSESERAQTIQNLKQADKVFKRLWGRIYISPSLLKYPRIIGSIKLLWVVSPTFAKLLQSYEKGYYTLRFSVATLDSGIHLETLSNARTKTTTIVFNRRYIVNGEFCPTVTKDNLHLEYNPQEQTYSLRVFTSLLTHEAIHAHHFTILYDAWMRGYNKETFYQYLIGKEFSEEFADAFARIYPNYPPLKQDGISFQEAMHEFMRKHCLGSIHGGGDAAEEARRLSPARAGCVGGDEG